MNWRVGAITCLFSVMVSIAESEKPIVVIIPSYNNESWVLRNLASAIKQRYANYRIVYINDCSSDRTGEIIDACVERYHLQNLVQVIHNPTRKGALANLYHTIHACKDEEIIVTLDGDDWFVHEDVLSRINQQYQDPSVWMTYGQFKIFPEDKTGFCREVPLSIIQRNLFREYEWVTSHPRTFYAGLFKQVKLKDLLYEGIFLDVTWDMAFMFPMLEMAGPRIRFISEELYVYNQANVLNDFRQKMVRQLQCKFHILSKQKYTLTNAYKHEARTEVTGILFSDDPVELRQWLYSFNKQVSGVQKLFIVYPIRNEIADAYDELIKEYEQFYWISVDGASLYKKIVALLAHINTPYVFFCHDKNQFIATCDMQRCVRWLDATKAFSLCGAVSKEDTDAPVMIELEDDFYAWQYQYGSFAFKQKYHGNMGLYRREHLQEALSKVRCAHYAQLWEQLNSLQCDGSEVGLCCRYPLIDGKSV